MLTVYSKGKKIKEKKILKDGVLPGKKEAVFKNEIKFIKQTKICPPAKKCGTKNNCATKNRK